MRGKLSSKGVEKEYGKHWICIMNITERTENLFGHMRKNWNPFHLIEENIVEDIFLFNISKGGDRMGEINYNCKRLWTQPLTVTSLSTFLLGGCGVW